MTNTLASPAFRAWAARFPLTRPIARRRSRALFDLCAGFAYSQILQSCVELDLFTLLHAGPQTPAALAPRIGLTPERATRLCEAATALKLLRRRGNAYALGPLGAAMVGNEGVTAMIRHHAILYRDLADPVALFRAEKGGTGLAAYWPYGTTADPAALEAADIATYSALMADSQPLVAAEILAAYDVTRHRSLLDIGGGEGTFLEQAAASRPQAAAQSIRLYRRSSARARTRLGARVTATGGDMRRDALPIRRRPPHAHPRHPRSRRLRRHGDPAPRPRRDSTHDGTLLLAEPVLDARGAEPVGAYFTLYLLALGSGRPRCQAELTTMLNEAGFSNVRPARTGNPLITSVLVAKL